jgi:P27 family predicted phage terminase small subunit
MMHEFQPPGDLPPLGRAYWNQVCPVLNQRFQLNDANLPRFEDLCRKIAEYVKLREFLKTSGYSFTGANGDPKERPEARCYFKLGREILAIEREFFITPASMARLPLVVRVSDQEREEDDFY